MGHTTEDKPSPAHARKSTLAALLAILVLGTGAATSVAAPSIDELNSRISGAKEQAQALGAQIESTTAELAAAQQQAIAAAQREAQLSAVLEQGRERERRLEAQVARTRDELAAARAQLNRGLKALSNRLVDIYRAGMPDATTLLLESDGFDDLQTRAEYLRRIEEADASLVSRVRTLRDQVSQRLGEVEEAQQKAEEFNAQIEAARDEIAAVRADAEAQASHLAALRDQRQAAVESLQSQVGRWTDQVQRLERISAEQAQSEVMAWFGDWAIPEAIVICESGGNFEAVNPSSGAGGAYQILPSTWELYGGEGQPQDASPEQQSEIAAQIWADSGAAAWECAG
ncbi:MAG TPA: transglycosylase family protein [Solirubrobacterales bacterium]|jgi:peptidoglycan hydrolase CwlO-like protein